MRWFPVVRHATFEFLCSPCILSFYTPGNGERQAESTKEIKELQEKLAATKAGTTVVGFCWMDWFLAVGISCYPATKIHTNTMSLSGKSCDWQLDAILRCSCEAFEYNLIPVILIFIIVVMVSSSAESSRVMSKDVEAEAAAAVQEHETLQETQSMLDCLQFRARLLNTLTDSRAIASS